MMAFSANSRHSRFLGCSNVTALIRGSGLFIHRFQRGAMVRRFKSPIYVASISTTHWESMLTGLG